MKIEHPRKLTETDPLENFSCGISFIDEWVQTRAAKAEQRGTAVVYVSCCEGRVAGIYSLCTHSIVRDDISGGWLKRNTPESIPTILLGILAVDKQFQQLGLGASLLQDALLRSLAVAEQIGAKALLVDPVDDNATAFYTHFGFKPIPGMTRMYVSLARLLATNNIVEVFIPDEEAEAAHDLVRAHDDIKKDLMRARQRLNMFLMRHGYIFNEKASSGTLKSHWTQAHWRWIRSIDFVEEADSDTFALYISEVRHLEAQKRQLENFIARKANRDHAIKDK